MYTNHTRFVLFTSPQRFIQYLASRTSLFNLSNFIDKTGSHGEFVIFCVWVWNKKTSIISFHNTVYVLNLSFISSLSFSKDTTCQHSSDDMRGTWTRRRMLTARWPSTSPGLRRGMSIDSGNRRLMEICFGIVQTQVAHIVTVVGWNKNVPALCKNFAFPSPWTLFSFLRAQSWGCDEDYGSWQASEGHACSADSNRHTAGVWCE